MNALKVLGAFLLGLVIGGVVTEQLEHTERIASLEAETADLRATIEEMRMARDE